MHVLLLSLFIPSCWTEKDTFTAVSLAEKLLSFLSSYLKEWNIVYYLMFYSLDNSLLFLWRVTVETQWLHASQWLPIAAAALPPLLKKIKALAQGWLEITIKAQTGNLEILRSLCLFSYQWELYQYPDVTKLPVVSSLARIIKIQCNSAQSLLNKLWKSTTRCWNESLFWISNNSEEKNPTISDSSIQKNSLTFLFKSSSSVLQILSKLTSSNSPNSSYWCTTPERPSSPLV